MNKFELFVIGAKKLISDNFAPSVKSHGKAVLIYLSVIIGFMTISKILGLVTCRIAHSLFNINLSLPNSSDSETTIGVILVLVSVFVFSLILYVKDFIKKAVAEGNLENAKKDLEIAKKNGRKE